MNMKKLKLSFIIVIAGLGGLGVSFASGTKPIVFTTTPSLFEINLNPGESWSSNLLVANKNSEDLILHLSKVNLDEGMAPIVNSEFGVFINSLSDWISFDNEVISLAKKQNLAVPFHLQLPADAQPGKHFAALLVGTQPLMIGSGGAKSASFISSVVSVSVGGAIRSVGSIKSFITEKKIYEKPEVGFLLTFQNNGNVNLKPSGRIIIDNNRGEEMGSVILSSNSPILSGESRKFTIRWEGDKSVNRPGRYRAVVDLTFGENAQEATEEVTFWIIPVTLILGSVGALCLFLLLLFFAVRAIRAYVDGIVEGELSPLAAMGGDAVAASVGWRKFGLVAASLLLVIAGGVGARYVVEIAGSDSGLDKPQAVASLIHVSYFLSDFKTDEKLREIIIPKDQGRSVSFAKLFHNLFPFLDAAFLDGYFENDFTFFQYQDSHGSWPGYVAKIKNGQAFNSVFALILENYGERFFPSVESLGLFRDGLVAGAKTRYAVGFQPGAALNYGVFGDYLVISASFEGFKLAIGALGITF